VTSRQREREQGWCGSGAVRGRLGRHTRARTIPVIQYVKTHLFLSPAYTVRMVGPLQTPSQELNLIFACFLSVLSAERSWIRARHCGQSPSFSARCGTFVQNEKTKARDLLRCLQCRTGFECPNSGCACLDAITKSIDVLLSYLPCSELKEWKRVGDYRMNTAALYGSDMH
jgi:hypothetical protein